MRILIHGSRPGAQRADGDVIYFINGSIREREWFSPHARVIHVVANRGFQKSVANPDNRSALSYSVAGFCNAKADRTIIVGRGDFDVTVRMLKDLNYRTGQYEFHDTELRDQLVRDVTGISLPTGIRFSSLLGPVTGAKYLTGLAISYVRMANNRDNKHDWFMMFRPSNGVYSLLHAISAYGYDHDYFLSGVGLQATHYTYRTAQGDAIYRRFERPHLFADHTVLRALPSVSSLKTDDPLISEQTGVSLFMEDSGVAEAFG